MKTLPKEKLKRVVFLDRDGVLNRKAPEHDYVKNYSEFIWNRDGQELVKRINDLGFLAVVISNQRGVARGLMTVDFVNELHRRMNEELANCGAHIDAFYFCTHNLMDECSCRKPAPGMFLTAATELGVDLSRSYSIGDSESDHLAAARAGCKSIKIETDKIELDKIFSLIKF